MNASQRHHHAYSTAQSMTASRGSPGPARSLVPSFNYSYDPNRTYSSSCDGGPFSQYRGSGGRPSYAPPTVASTSHPYSPIQQSFVRIPYSQVSPPATPLLPPATSLVSPATPLPPPLLSYSDNDNGWSAGSDSNFKKTIIETVNALRFDQHHENGPIELLDEEVQIRLDRLSVALTKEFDHWTESSLHPSQKQASHMPPSVIESEAKKSSIGTAVQQEANSDPSYKQVSFNDAAAKSRMSNSRMLPGISTSVQSPRDSDRFNETIDRLTKTYLPSVSIPAEDGSRKNVIVVTLGDDCDTRSGHTASTEGLAAFTSLNDDQERRSFDRPLLPLPVEKETSSKYKTEYNHPPTSRIPRSILSNDPAFGAYLDPSAAYSTPTIGSSWAAHKQVTPKDKERDPPGQPQSTRSTDTSKMSGTNHYFRRPHEPFEEIYNVPSSNKRTRPEGGQGSASSEMSYLRSQMSNMQAEIRGLSRVLESLSTPTSRGYPL